MHAAVVVAFALLTSTPEPASHETSALSLILLGPGGSLRVAEPILFFVMVENIAAEPVTLGASMFPSGFHLQMIVTGPDGKIMPYRGFPSHDYASRDETLRLHRPYFFGMKLDLNEFFEMSRPGWYRVQARYSLGLKFTDNDLYSSAVDIFLEEQNACRALPWGPYEE